MMKLLFLVISLLFFLKDSVASQADSTQKKNKNLSITGLALPARTPENGWLGQGGVIGIFKSQPSDSLLRASNLYLFGMYSQYKQYRISIGGDFFSPKEKYFINFWYYYSKVPDLFFGVGNNVSPNKSEFINYSTWYFNTIILRKIKSRWYLGMAHYSESQNDISFVENGIFANTVYPGKTSYVIHALGPKIRYDSRDNIFNTKSGFYFDYELVNASGAISDYIFTTQTLELRHFLPLNKNKKHILCNRILFMDAAGNVPFRQLPYIDSEGYNRNTFRNNKLSEWQIEYRAYLYKRLGCTLFGGLSTISKEWAASTAIKPNAGLGVRVNVIPKYNLNLRIDAGFGVNSFSTYLAFYETF